jgi:hypothetical protein
MFQTFRDAVNHTIRNYEVEVSGKTSPKINIKCSMEVKSSAELHLVKYSDKETDKTCGAKDSAGT